MHVQKLIDERLPDLDGAQASPEKNVHYSRTPATDDIRRSGRRLHASFEMKEAANRRGLNNLEDEGLLVHSTNYHDIVLCKVFPEFLIFSYSGE